MMSFADRNNDATQTWRGNGTNENGPASGISGTIYMKSRAHGPARQRVPDGEPDRHRPFHDGGQPVDRDDLATTTSKNYTETHTVAGRRPTTARPTTTVSRRSCVLQVLSMSTRFNDVALMPPLGVVHFSWRS